MKPDGPVLRARDWSVRRVEHGQARAFIKSIHYAKGAGNTSVYALGLFRRDDPERLQGVSLWLPPPRPAARHVARKLWIPEDTVLVLTRLACAPDVPTNGASFLLGRSIRVIRKDPRWWGLVTYADQRLEHKGTIYHATGWQPSGQTKPEALWMDPTTGQLVSRRAGLDGSPHQTSSEVRWRFGRSVWPAANAILPASSRSTKRPAVVVKPCSCSPRMSIRRAAAAALMTASWRSGRGTSNTSVVFWPVSRCW